MRVDEVALKTKLCCCFSFWGGGGGSLFSVDTRDGAHGGKHIKETNLEQTARSLFAAFALEVSNNEAGFLAVSTFTDAT